MNRMRRCASAIGVSLMLSIAYPIISFADVMPKVYGGYDYTIKEVITVKNESDEPFENLFQNIKYDKRGDSPYQENYDIRYTIDTGNIIEYKNNDTKDTFDRDIKIGTLYPGQQISYTIHRDFFNGKIDYSIDPKEFDNYKYDTDKFAKYLKPEYHIESNDPLIIEKTKEIVGDETNPYNKAKKIYEFVNTYIKYDNSEANTGALNALKTGKGVCEEYATLFVAMSRVAGIPARRVNGIWVTHNGDTGKYYKLSGILHGWAEVYLPNSWMIVEPTEEYNGRKEPSWDTFFKDLEGSHFIGGYDTDVVSKITSYEEDEDSKTYFLDGRLRITRDFYIKKESSKNEQISEYMREAENLNFNNYYSLKQLVSSLPQSERKDAYNKKLTSLDHIYKCIYENPTQEELNSTLKSIDLFGTKDIMRSKLLSVQIDINKRNIRDIQGNKANISFVQKDDVDGYSFGIDNTGEIPKVTVYYNNFVKVETVSGEDLPSIKIQDLTMGKMAKVRFADSRAIIEFGS